MRRAIQKHLEDPLSMHIISGALKDGQEIGAKLGIPADALIPYGHDKAKISYDFLSDIGNKEDGKLIREIELTSPPVFDGSPPRPTA